MGMDLTLCPYSHDPSTWGWHLAVDRLNLDRNSALFEQIGEYVTGNGKKKPVCIPKPLPPNVRFTWYEDDGMKDRQDDQYGSPLTYVLAHELSKVNTEKTSSWNKAVFAMIRALEPQTPIILWWH